MFFCIISNVSYSQEKDQLDNALLKSKELNLELHVKWHSLIHYERGILSSSSSVTNQEFFLSSQGQQKPQEELRATISAFFNYPESQCRFPARLMWLKSVMPNIQFPKANCPEYHSFMNSFRTNSISVVYASGYLGNPASMYGHVLLKFNDLSSNELLDNTYSYGATVLDSDNKLTYIYKGITGGYQGHFANQKYHHQNLTYNESELRDLWEYRLKLTQYDIDFLLAHLWELENTSMTYYFFKQNCGYQLARLLELVIDKPLLAPTKIWVMPYDLIMMLNQPETIKYVEKVIYHGSRQEDLYNRFNQLNHEEKMCVESIIKHPQEETLRILRSLDEESAKKVIDTMYDYYAFIEVKHDGLSDEQVSKRKQLLTERFYLPEEQLKWKKTNKQPPHMAQNTAMIQLSPLYNESYGNGAMVRFRANYYDLLNLNAARIPYSELKTFDLSLLYTEEQKLWSVRELVLFNIINLSVSKTGLAEDASHAWALGAGYKPTSLSCIDCSDMYVNGFLGESLSLSDNFAGYVALAGEIQFSDLSSSNVKSGPEIGGVLTLAPFWKTSLKIGSYYDLSNLAEHENYLKWEQRFFENRNFDFRISVRYDDVFEYAINFSTYW